MRVMRFMLMLLTPCVRGRKVMGNQAISRRWACKVAESNTLVRKCPGGINARAASSASRRIRRNGVFASRTSRPVVSSSDNRRTLVTKTRDAPSCRALRTPMTASYVSRFSQNGQNSAGRVCRSESV